MEKDTSSKPEEEISKENPELLCHYYYPLDIEETLESFHEKNGEGINKKGVVYLTTAEKAKELFKKSEKSKRDDPIRYSVSIIVEENSLRDFENKLDTQIIEKKMRYKLNNVTFLVRCLGEEEENLFKKILEERSLSHMLPGIKAQPEETKETQTENENMIKDEVSESKK
ncbi:MAG: hypothetical protein Nk1A_6940 [Endomicrobiia bacterium]|nr:MAG: hypothetical protein Nk1A_6940 [Endomicrobiia bacterium]